MIFRRKPNTKRACDLTVRDRIVSKATGKLLPIKRLSAHGGLMMDSYIDVEIEDSGRTTSTLEFEWNERVEVR